MSLETDGMFNDFTDEEQEIADAVRKEEEAKRIKAEREFLVENRCFKDLIMGREEAWEAVKDNMALYCFRLPEIGNEVISKDLLVGIRFALEMIDARVKQWDETFAKGGN